MRRAVAFCPKIKDSKKITGIFNDSSEAYINDLPATKKERMVSVASQHIDGTMSAPERDELLSWLKADMESNECNVRCLSEGVDVPSLDAVMFLSARNSQVDVVHSLWAGLCVEPRANSTAILLFLWWYPRLWRQTRPLMMGFPLLIQYPAECWIRVSYLKPIP